VAASPQAAINDQRDAARRQSMVKQPVMDVDPGLLRKSGGPGKNRRANREARIEQGEIAIAIIGAVIPKDGCGLLAPKDAKRTAEKAHEQTSAIPKISMPGLKLYRREPQQRSSQRSRYERHLEVSTLQCGISGSSDRGPHESSIDAFESGIVIGSRRSSDEARGGRRVMTPRGPSALKSNLEMALVTAPLG